MGTLWHNAFIYTMARENELVEAVYTEAGMIIDAGEFVSLKEKYRLTIKRIMDLAGGMMLPGLVDSHMHLIGHGVQLTRLDLSKMKSREEVLAALKKKCHDTPVGQWIIAEGWNEKEWENPSLILRDDLDAISEQHPIVIKRICRHALVVNSTALVLSNVSEAVNEPSGCVIGRYKDGRLSGLFKEDLAMEMILSSIPGITDDYVRNALKTAIEDAYRLGLTGGHTEDLNYYHGFLPTLRAFKTIIEEEGKTFRANLLVHHGVIDDMDNAGLKYRDRIGHIELDAMKIFADGSLGGYTALLSRPYANNPETNGVAIFSEEELQQLVKKARQYKMPVAVHAIGDLAFEYVINAIEAFPPPAGTRDRMIHAQIMRKDLLERAKVLPLIFDIQPGFVPSDFPWVIESIGMENMDYNYAWKTFLNEGIHCAGGSDAPIEQLNPLLGIHAAVTRRKPDDRTRIVYGESERLSMFEAISLYTTGSAYAIGRETNRGKIAPGFFADFTIFEHDLFQLEVDELLETKVSMTVIDDKIVYQNNQEL